MNIVWKYRIPLLAILCCIYGSVSAQNELPIKEEEKTAPGLSPPGAHPVEEAPRRLFMIDKIYINGNKKTKDFIIKRELPFKEGDSVALNQLVAQFRLGKQQLVNTRCLMM
ncbi:POTRA domain-containing protein [Flavihumibacter sp. CACIAM 22H1]|uniref:POTRA domain-containing protein n=1 Tax=Flavihumibacter sp. CACIAM 22H1 TaxID=1812911 RepID=UPI0007A90360|nr:POTRA domain-containing protein [Flavihumibacter sp. CACIAM 22H1]KYP13795.1 MAG: hypothetical protein A1D16_02935 [Flavihumibacter sp. CACIAM 22H1]